MYRASLSLISMATIFVTFGCGQKEDANRPKRVDASGTVTLNGSPVEGANVVFVPESGGHPASARTDANGSFELTTFDDGDGAVPGNYSVAISKMESTVAETGPDMRDPGYNPLQMKKEKRPEPKHLLPKKYSEAKTSELKATVSADGDNEFTFQLTE